MPRIKKSCTSADYINSYLEVEKAFYDKFLINVPKCSVIKSFSFEEFEKLNLELFACSYDKPISLSFMEFEMIENFSSNLNEGNTDKTITPSLNDDPCLICVDNSENDDEILYFDTKQNYSNGIHEPLRDDLFMPNNIELNKYYSLDRAKFDIDVIESFDSSVTSNHACNVDDELAILSEYISVYDTVPNPFNYFEILVLQHNQEDKNEMVESGLKLLTTRQFEDFEFIPVPFIEESYSDDWLYSLELSSQHSLNAAHFLEDMEECPELFNIKKYSIKIFSETDSIKCHLDIENEMIYLLDNGNNANKNNLDKFEEIVFQEPVLSTPFEDNFHLLTANDFTSTKLDSSFKTPDNQLSRYGDNNLNITINPGESECDVNEYSINSKSSAELSMFTTRMSNFNCSTPFQDKKTSSIKSDNFFRTHKAQPRKIVNDGFRTPNYQSLDSNVNKTINSEETDQDLNNYSSNSKRSVELSMGITKIANISCSTPINCKRTSSLKSENLIKIPKVEPTLRNREIFYKLQEHEIHVLKIIQKASEDKIRYLKLTGVLNAKLHFCHITMDVFKEISGKTEYQATLITSLKILTYARHMFEMYGIQACFVSFQKIILKYQNFLEENEFIGQQIKCAIELLAEHFQIIGSQFKSKLSSIRHFLEPMLVYLDGKTVIKPYIFILTRNCYKLVYNLLYEELFDLINIYPKSNKYENVSPLFSRFNCAIGLPDSIRAAIQSDHSQVEMVIDFDYEIDKIKDIQNLCDKYSVIYVPVQLNRSNMKAKFLETVMCSIELNKYTRRKVFATEYLFVFDSVVYDLERRNVKFIKRKVNIDHNVIPDIILNAHAGILLQPFSSLTDFNVRKCVILRIRKLLETQLNVLYLFILNTDTELEHDFENMDFYMKTFGISNIGQNQIEEILKEIVDVVNDINVNEFVEFQIKICSNLNKFKNDLFDTICDNEELNFDYDWISESESQVERNLTKTSFLNPYSAQFIMNLEKLPFANGGNKYNLSMIHVMKHFFPRSVIESIQENSVADNSNSNIGYDNNDISTSRQVSKHSGNLSMSESLVPRKTAKIRPYRFNNCSTNENARSCKKITTIFNTN